jgi:hypothetical protein
MEKKSVFRPESLDRLSSPEKLDDYIKVSNPGIWMGLAALFLCAVSVIVWGIAGTLPQTMTLNGTANADEGGVICYVAAEDMPPDLVGREARITLPDGGVQIGTVMSVSANPYSNREMAALLDSDWLMEQLAIGGYSYAVTVEAAGISDLAADTLVGVSIVTAEVKPISFLWN